MIEEPSNHSTFVSTCEQGVKNQWKNRKKKKIMQSREFHIKLLISEDDDGKDNNMFIVG